jgi:hypothetical protein
MIGPFPADRSAPGIGLTPERFGCNPPIHAVEPVFGDEPVATRPKPKIDETWIETSQLMERGVTLAR